MDGNATVEVEVHAGGVVTKSLRALLDSGASSNYIRGDSVALKGVDLLPYRYPIPTEMIDGSSLPGGPITHYVMANLVIGGNLVISNKLLVKLDISNDLTSEIILGLDFHQTW
jgi:hypothetical protein